MRNLCVLSAMAAGRAPTGSIRAQCLIAEFVMYVVVFWASVRVVDPRSGVYIVVALILGFLIAVPLAFLENAAVGRRSRFGADLRGSLWLGRFADPFCVSAPYPPKPADRTSP
jgi:hypothetical protein